MGGQKGRPPCVASERCRPECRLTTRPDGAFLKVSGMVMSSPLKERSHESLAQAMAFDGHGMQDSCPNGQLLLELKS